MIIRDAFNDTVIQGLSRDKRQEADVKDENQGKFGQHLISLIKT